MQDRRREFLSLPVKTAIIGRNGRIPMGVKHVCFNGG
jgi:hypothetical protein